MKRSCGLCEVNDHGNVIRSALPLAFITINFCCGDALRELGRGVDKVDAHSLIFGEAKFLVVPVGVLIDALAGNLFPAVLSESEEGISFGGGDVCLTFESGYIPNVMIVGCNIPVANQCNLAFFFKPRISNCE